MMKAFLTSNEWPWRLVRTIVQGVLGVVVANVDMLVGCAVLEPEWRAVVVALVMAVLSPVMAELGAARASRRPRRTAGSPARARTAASRRCPMAYSILFKQCGSDHMTRGRSRAIDRIVMHFTATLASARNNATYFARNEGQGASAHYFVDDITPEIYQSVAEGGTAWHAGDWQMNCRAVGIEVVSAGDDFSATEVEKLGWLVKRLMAKYGIGASGVIRHYGVTGKLCPAPYVAASKWAALKAAITGGVVSGGTTPAAPGGTVAELARRVIAG